jgi:hypothetical protein
MGGRSGVLRTGDTYAIIGGPKNLVMEIAKKLKQFLLSM